MRIPKLKEKAQVLGKNIPSKLMFKIKSLASAVEKLYNSVEKWKIKPGILYWAYKGSSFHCDIFLTWHVRSKGLQEFKLTQRLFSGSLYLSSPEKTRLHPEISFWNRKKLTNWKLPTVSTVRLSKLQLHSLRLLCPRNLKFETTCTVHTAVFWSQWVMKDAILISAYYDRSN